MEIKLLFPPLSQPGFDWKPVIELIPHAIWGAVVLIIIAMIGPKRLANALLNARKISFGGLEIELKSDIASVVQARGAPVLPQLEGQVARRAERSLSLTTGARLLWIDEHPKNNANEIKLLKRLGVQIDLASSDDIASKRLAQAVYDVVLSNMTRANDGDAGEKFLPNILAATLSPMVIFYVGKDRRIPNGALGLTTRPDELLNLLLDALERAKG